MDGGWGGLGSWGESFQKRAGAVFEMLREQCGP